MSSIPLPIQFLCAAVLLSAACGSKEAALPSGPQSRIEPQLNAMDAGTPVGSWIKVELERPAGVIWNAAFETDGGQKLIWNGPFDVKVGERRRWVSGQTLLVSAPGDTRNGPMLLWEQSDRGEPFRSAALPTTEIAYFPEICAASDDDVYISVTNWKYDGTPAHRLFRRNAGERPVFIEEPLPPPPPNRDFMHLTLQCFANGELWLAGHAQLGDELNELAVLYHRAATSAPWSSIALPTGIAPGAYGLHAALLRPDGSGHVVIERSLFERSATGQWTARGSLPSSVSQVRSLAELPGREIAAPVWPFAGSGSSHLRFVAGQWTLEAVPGLSDVGAIVAGNGQILIAGSSLHAGVEKVTLAQPPQLLVTSVSGKVFRLQSEKANAAGLAIIHSEASHDVYEWSR